MKTLKKLSIILILSCIFLPNVFADALQDLELANELLVTAEYGAKTSWTKKELENLEKSVSKFSDKTLAEVWRGNIILYSLSTYPVQCKIAKRNVSQLSDESLRSIWKTNLTLYGC